MKQLPAYLTMDKPIVIDVFGVINDTLRRKPEILDELKKYLEEKEKEIGKGRMV